MQADVDHRDFETSAQREQDKKLLVKFYIKQREDKTASLKAGRPIFRDVEYIDIKIPGNRTGGFAGPATHDHKVNRFPEHYQAFKDRISLPLEGTPLSEWPMIQRSLVEELSFHNVKTVEQLVDMSDTHASKFMGIQDLKRKAAKWLEESNETARINQIEKLESENAELKEQLASLAAKVDKLDVAAEAIEEAAKPKPKPKRRTAAKKA